MGRIQPDYITQYEAVFGPSYHAFTANDCLFIVVNASLINSGLQAEETQRGWLEDVLATNKGRTFVSIHYPPYVLSEHERAATTTSTSLDVIGSWVSSRSTSRKPYSQVTSTIFGMIDTTRRPLYPAGDILRAAGLQ